MYRKKVAFVIDLHKLDNPLDVRADENGSWIRKGSPTAYDFKISRTYYRHSASPDFYHTITMAYGMLNFKSIIVTFSII